MKELLIGILLILVGLALFDSTIKNYKLTLESNLHQGALYEAYKAGCYDAHDFRPGANTDCITEAYKWQKAYVEQINKIQQLTVKEIINHLLNRI